MTTMVKWGFSLTAWILAASLTLPAQAQDAELKGELQKLVDEAVKVVEKRSGERLSKLEAELKARDQRIVELEAKVKELLAKAPAPAPVVPPAQPTNTFLGVGHIDVPADLRSKHKIEGGALVTQVLEESPAAGAGLVVNDILLDIQGTPVTSTNLSAVIAGLKSDQEVNITYLHDGARLTKALKLGDREKYFAARAARSQPAPAKKEPVVLGVQVQERDGGLFVENVEEGFTGAVAGLKAGDRVTHLNGKELKSIEDVQGELKKLVDGDKLILAFTRGEEKVTVSVLGAHGKGSAKVLASESVKPTPKAEPKPEPKPADKKPGFLGVAVVEDASGVVIESVVSESAAAAAGLKKGDLVQKLNGKDVGGVDGLKSLLGGVNAGDKISLDLVREGKPVAIKDLELKAEGEKVAVAKPDATKPDAPKPPQAKKKGYLGIYATQTVTNEVLVKSVNPGGAGEKAELKVGDIILKINDKPVTSFDDLINVLNPLFAGDSIKLRVKRGNEEKEVTLTLSEV